MQVNAAVVDNHVLHLLSSDAQAKPHTSLITRIFGCHHAYMGRPITAGRQTYRACVDCGARRKFNSDTWQMEGPYYFFIDPNVTRWWNIARS